MQPNKQVSLQTILLVDDMPENLKVLGNIILNSNYEILVASSGTKGIEIAQSESPDLILLDIQMPEMDGFEVCQRLKNDEKTRDIPVIFITARSETDDMVKGFEAGGVDYITKPFQSKELLARVKTHIELKIARQEMAEMAATKDKFLTIIAHDLKNPFNSLLGLSNILIDEIDVLDKPEILQHIKIIEHTAQNAFSLLQNLLQWAMAHTGKIEFNPQKIDISELVNESIEVIKSQADNKSIHILTNIVGNHIVFADKNMIGTVLNNLISNAIKFTKNGGYVKLVLESSFNQTTISISDNGVGIPEKHVKTLFQIDSKHTSTGTDMETGTGLGLLICKEFIDFHKGKIWAESKEGQGSIFRFTIPNA